MLASCSTGQVQETRSPRAQKELAEALAGLTPDRRCAASTTIRLEQMQVIDDWTILFRDGRTIYVQNPRGGCSGLANRNRTLVTRQFGTTDLCDGDYQPPGRPGSRGPGRRLHLWAVRPLHQTEARPSV